MTKRKEIHEWLNDDPEQLRWAKEYLLKRNIPLPIERGYQQVLASLSQMGKERLRLMRLAWNQHGSKAKRKRKTYSFTLSSKAGRALKQLAGRRPHSHVLEDLLTQIEMLKAETREKVEQRHYLDLRRRQSAFEDLESVMKEWQQRTDRFLMEWSRQRILLEAQGLNAATDLSEEQDHQALPVHKQAEQEFLELQKKWDKAVKLHKSLSLTPAMSRPQRLLGAAQIQSLPAAVNQPADDSQGAALPLVPSKT